jgi:plasmid stabilization system protein ParE
MALIVRLDVQAEHDLQSIRDYLIERAGATLANRVRLHIRSRINLLGRRPNIGLPTDNPGVQILPPTRYPYRIYYTLTADAVVILHIRHTARREPDLAEFDV